ncbi:Gfo/Idh/MocA family oxidoreductase, partial [bacterium]|nr:Gfo/Idh/MocA family oxidoreductase [bacterium]
MINCGIIGFGKMGKIRANAIENSGKGKVTLIYDIAPPIDDTYLIANNPSEIIESQDIDAVFVCTPNVYIPVLCI